MLIIIHSATARSKYQITVISYNAEFSIGCKNAKSSRQHAAVIVQMNKKTHSQTQQLVSAIGPI